MLTINNGSISTETCSKYNGEWLDDVELGKVVRTRNARFDPHERRAIAQSTTITGVVLENVDRNLKCPNCGGTTDAVNYDGDTEIIIDRCTSCRDTWLDEHELEKI